MNRSGGFLAAAMLWALGATPVGAAPMQFRMAGVGENGGCGAKCPQVIIAEGEITEATPRDFIAFIRTQRYNSRARAIIFLHSPGGRVMASMELGRLFRRSGAAAVVAKVGTGGFVTAQCYSACVYALMGAKKRVIPPGSRVGIHRMFMFERFGGMGDEGQSVGKTYANNDLVTRLGDYAGMMGVSRELVYTAEKIEPERVHVISPSEIRRWRLGSEKF